jgi:cell shape-determining protein MreC
MLNTCVKVVFCLRKSLLINFELSTFSTIIKRYLTSQVSFPRNLFATFNQFLKSFAQTFDLLSGWFYPVYTGPINTTNLIKDLYL